MCTSTVTRLEKFRQLKKEIRGSENHLIVGIDVAKEKHYAFFGTANGKSLLRRLIFDNDRDGFEKLVNTAESISSREVLTKLIFGVEPTADYHKPLSEYLIRKGFPLVLVSNGAVKHNRELLDGRWDKNDTKDSANIADLISQGKFLYYDYPSAQVRDLRHLLSLKQKLKCQEHSVRMRIRNHLVCQFFPELDRFYGKRESENLAIVKWCLNPEKIASMSFGEFVQLVTSRDRGHVQRDRLHSIQETARQSIGCEVGESVAFEAKMLVIKLVELRESIKELDSKINQMSAQLLGYTSIISIPGVGPATAAVILAAIGDPQRFTSAKQVLKLAGLDLSASRSGKNAANATAKLSKKGNARLRYALYQAGLVASYRNKYFVDYYTRILSGREREHGIKTKMRVKVAAKILVIAWSLMKSGEIFQGEYLLNTEVR
jgi:transposase